MPLYESRQHAENKIVINPELHAAIISGPDQVIPALVAIFTRKYTGHTLTVAFDGWYGVDWPAIVAALRQASAGQISIEFKPASALFKPIPEIDAYKLQFTETDDPGFGVCNTEGHISDLMDAGKVAVLAAELAQRRGTQAAHPEVIIVFGPGAAIPELDSFYDLRFYFDKTRQPILWEMWDGKLVPFGWNFPRKITSGRNITTAITTCWTARSII